MFRKIILSLVLPVLLFGLVSVTSAADPLATGCFVDAPASVNEGQTFTVAVKCNTIPELAFGFQFATTLSGQATSSATAYTPGTFVTTALNLLVIEASNSRSGVYAVTRLGADVINGTFTLGSFTATANTGLTSNGSATVALPAASFKLSNLLGQPINRLQASPNATITINNINLSTISGNVAVTTDGSINTLKNISLSLDGAAQNQASVASNQASFTLPAGPQYTDLNVDVIADMASHLACTKTYTLADGTNTALSAIGTITLYAGDVVTVSDSAINIQDATALGSAYGTAGSGELDVNADGIVDIYDLVHVGRNYNRTSGACV